MKKAIFFDLYGTLIEIKTDENDPWVYSVLSNYFLYQSVKIEPDELKRAYFEEIDQHLRRNKELYPEVDVYEVFHKIMHRYGNRKYSKDVIVDVAMFFRLLTVRHFGLFPFLLDTLTQLIKKYRIAIISDAQWVFAEPEIKILDLDRFFKLKLLSSRFGFKKPDVRLFTIAMEKFKVKPEESVYIGDNIRKDLLGAKKAGMGFILFGSEFQECNGFKPDGVFRDYALLENIIDAIL